MPATITPETDKPETIETAEPIEEPTTDDDQGAGAAAEPLDLVGASLAA